MEFKDVFNVAFDASSEDIRKSVEYLSFLK